MDWLSRDLNPSVNAADKFTQGSMYMAKTYIETLDLLGGINYLYIVLDHILTL